jgi:uncharacterized membrane protein
MASRWRWVLRQLSRKLWVHVSLYCLGAIGISVAGILLDPYIPTHWSTDLGADALDDILNILASSMLAVTTFSLTTMVSALSAATSNVTPRATKLLTVDSTSQNVLGTFVGAFLFSLIGIIALSTGLYGRQGQFILFAATLVVIAVIIVTLLRWIDHLAHLGRVGETTDKVETATRDALEERAKTPCLGANCLATLARIPHNCDPVYAAKIGYVQHIDVGSLSSCAEKHDGQIFVLALPGAFADPGHPIAYVNHIDGKAHDKIRAAFTIDDERTYDADPRFGFCVLAEIASRALSPAVNDPGTAIDVIGRAVRLLLTWEQEKIPDDRVAYPRVWAPPLKIEDMFDDVFTSIARDGANMVEVQIRLQKALFTLSRAKRPGFALAAQIHSQFALEQSKPCMRTERERSLLRSLAAKVSGDQA